MPSSIATESLTQRGESPLFKDLIRLHEKVGERIGNSVDDKEVAHTLNQAGFYSQQLMAVVKKHMGVTLQEVHVYKDKQPNARMVPRDTLDAHRQRRSGQATTGMMMATIKKLYDDRKAYLSLPTDHLPFTFSLWISTKWWTLRDNQGNRVFTPREISAVVLHELGHVDHYLKSFARVYGRLTDSADVVDYLQTSHDKDTIMAVLTAIRKSPFLNPAWLSILDSTEKYFKTTNSFDDPVYWEALTALSTLMAAESSQRIAMEVTTILGKGRDQVSTHLHQVDPERQPDEFAARNGAYTDSVSLLSKSQASYERWKTSTFVPAFFQSTLGYFYHLFDLPAESIAFGYDPIMRRMELFVETAKHAFHDQNLPQEAKSEITYQIQQAEKIITDYHSASHRALRTKIKTWMDNVSTFGRIFTSPFQNRLTGDYGRLQEASRSVSRHSLFYLADKQR